MRRIGFLRRKKGHNYTAFNKKKNYYFDDLLSIYGRIEEYLGLMGVLAISIITSWTLLRSTVRLIVTVFYFILSYVVINLLIDNSIHVGSIWVLLPLLIGYYLSVIYICSVIIHIFDFYREYMNEIVEEENED
jgi:hypothetical protein